MGRARGRADCPVIGRFPPAVIDRGQIRTSVHGVNRPPRAKPTEALALDPIFLRVLRTIAQHPRLSQRELATRVGISLGKANFCLQAMIQRGLLKVQNYRKSTNKLAYLYLITPSGMRAKARLTRRFLTRKLEEYEALRAEIEGLRRESEAELSTRSSELSTRNGSRAAC